MIGRREPDRVHRRSNSKARLATNASVPRDTMSFALALSTLPRVMMAAAMGQMEQAA